MGEDWTELFRNLLLCGRFSEAMTNAFILPASSDVNRQQKMLYASCWTSTTASSPIINPSAWSVAAAADNNMDARCYDTDCVRHNTRRPPYLLASGSSLPKSVAVDAVVRPTTATAARWNPTLQADRSMYQPPSAPMTYKTAMFRHHPPANGFPPQMYSRLPTAAVGHRPSGAGRSDARMSSMGHGDLAGRGAACIACEYIRHSTQLRHEPYNTTSRYSKHSESHRVAYY